MTAEERKEFDVATVAQKGRRKKKEPRARNRQDR
jgi:hypothetical protein